MLNIREIKVGDNFNRLKREIYKDENENIMLSTLPSFCNSEYKEIYNYDNKNEKLYVKVNKQGIITDIKYKYNEVVDIQKAVEMLSFVLDN